MNTIQYPVAYQIMFSRLAVNPKNPFENSATASSTFEPRPPYSMFSFEEVCVMAVGATCVGFGLLQLRKIYFATRSLSPTFYEIMDEMYANQKDNFKRLVFPIIHIRKASDQEDQSEL